MEKLTDIERQFATDNHNLIYKYLHEHSFCIEDYYGTAADGFLKAVMAYIRKPDLHDNYQFSTLACKYMKREISNQMKVEKAAKRTMPEPLLSYEEVAEMQYNTMADMLGNLIGDAMLNQMDKRQQDICILKLGGFNNTEICKILEIPSSSFYKEMSRIKDIVAIVLEV